MLLPSQAIRTESQNTQANPQVDADAASKRFSAHKNRPSDNHDSQEIGIENNEFDKGGDDAVGIVILRPWWVSPWAFACYAAVFLATVFGIYRIYMKRKVAEREVQRLKELDALKTQRYINITHEFRTSLTVILGMAKQVLDNPKDNFRNGMEIVIRNGQNLLRLVNQMLDLNKLASNKLSLHYQQGDVVGFIRYLCESFNSLAESKNVELHFLSDVEELVMDFDAERLQEVLANLLSNAIKSTLPDGVVYLQIGQIAAAIKSPSHLVIRVKYAGVGLAEVQPPQILDGIYQAVGTPDGHQDGTGIGLELTKALIAVMEGEIAVNSTIGKGTEFMITLPVRRQSELASAKEPFPSTVGEPGQDAVAPTSQQPLGAEKPLILLAEDSADVVTYLVACLSQDYRIEVVGDGDACVDKAQKLIPDLVISDLIMPARDGLEVCRTLKEDERTSHIPIVILSAKADMETKLKGFKVGADAYLTKPFNEEELCQRIKNLLDLRQQLQKHYRLLVGLDTHEQAEDDDQALGLLEDCFVKKVKQVVETHLDDSNFSVDMLCHEVGISNAQLYRKLTAITGLSATKFIRAIRLKRAKDLLEKSELSITTISMDVGFNDVSYFDKVFKQEFGLTPMEWRENRRSSNKQSGIYDSNIRE